MWIKNITKTLYLIILTRIFIATIICVCIFEILNWTIDLAVSYQSNIYMEKQSTLHETMVKEIRDKININHWTLSQAQNEDFTNDYPDYYIFFFSDVPYSDEIYTDFYEEQEYPLEKFKRSIFNNIKFADVEGIAIIIIKDAKIFYDVYYIGAWVVTLIIFFFITMQLFKPIIAYIEKIEKGINIIAQEDMLYKIPVVGKNELSRLADDINHMGSMLYEKQEKDKRTELSKKILITNVSHDLRTPLTSILGYIGLIKENMLPSDKSYEYVSIAEKNSLRLEKLINDLFMYSKLVSYDVSLNMVDIDAYVILRQIIELKKYYVHFEALVEKAYITVDVNQFHRTIDNLLDNAEKYRIPGSDIYLKVIKSEDNVLITISNKTDSDLTGKMEFLTKRLYTADMDKKTDSTGLGLSIVNELTKQMGGKFEIDYVDDTFTGKLIFPTANSIYK
ncbi:MAG: hypothetical protein CVV02_03995 [Firmicutes bacterium HGW-Firmicutes-7]|nr:MAG: hypothetical protein CVV02_03995 [Firmicutes bacterium HGW-Firmicutes-7]